MRRVLARALFVAAGFGIQPHAAPGQIPRPASADSLADSLAPATTPADSLLAELDARYEMVALSPHAHGTMMGMALRIPAGSAEDPVGREGTAHVLAHTLQARAEEVLGGLGGQVRTEASRSALTVTVLVTPDRWREVLERVHALVFREPLPAELVERVRLEILARARFRIGDPIQVFEVEAASVLVPPDSPWASAVRGTPTSLEAIGAHDVSAFRDRWLDPATTSLALAGPPGFDTPPATLPIHSSSRGASGRTVPDSAAVETVPWRAGDRVALVREVTSGWLSVAYPAPSSLSRTTLELLVHLLQEELDPVPPDPSRYSLSVELLSTPDGPVVQVRASLLPEAMARWETRIIEAVEALGERAMPDEFFRWKRRRFRARLLLLEAAPEAEATRMTRDLALLGRARALDAEVWSLDPDTVVDAARALGEPRILVFGPDLAQNQAPAR